MKLKYLINVFNVWPAFLLPVFYDGQEFFFQKIQNNYIEQFVVADLQRFEESYYFEVQNEISAIVNKNAFYAIGFTKSDFIYGDSKTIIDDYHKKNMKYEQDEEFKKQIISFVNKYNNTLMLSNMQNYMYNHMRNYMQCDLIMHRDFKMEHCSFEIMHPNFKIEPPKPTSAFREAFFENDYGVFYCIQNLTLTIDDIYLFKKIIDNNMHSSMTCNLLYQKQNSDAFMCISFQKQANIIDFVIKNQPREYHKKLNNLFFDKTSTYLWNMESICGVFIDNIINKSNLFKSLYKYQGYKEWRIREYLEKNLQDILTEWHLKLDGPILDLSKENFDDFRELLSLDVEREESELYLFNLISLSQKANTNMIVAQNFFNEKVYYFKIKEDCVSIFDIIDFLELLYKEHKKKITIVINDNEIFDNQQFYLWIEDNHDRFSIKSLPSFFGICK